MNTARPPGSGTHAAALAALTLLSVHAFSAGAEPGSARAGEVDPGWVVGLSPCYAFIVLGADVEPDGVGSGLFVHRTIDDALSLRLSGLWSVHDVDGTATREGGLYQVASFTFGVSYAFDLLSVVPAIEVGAGLLYTRFGGESSFDMGLRFGISADYWVLTWLSVGAAFHYHSFLTDPASYPVYFDAGPRVAVRWR